MKSLTIIGLVVAASVCRAQSTTLEQALMLARSNRPAIKASQLSIDRARLSANALSTYPGPTLGIGQSSRTGLGATDQDFFVSQPIDLFGRTSSSRTLGRTQLKLAEAEQRAVLLAVQSEVLKSYFEALSSTRLSEVSDELLKVATSLHQATKRRLEEGKIPEIQFTRATIELDRAKQAATLRKSQLRAALKRLAGAVGSDAELNSVDNAAALSAPEVDLGNRPDLLILSSQAEVAQSEARVASRLLMPDLELTGLRSPWRERDTNFGLRLQLSWRFDFGRGRSEQSASIKAVEAIQASLADARKRAESELAAIDIEIEAAESSVKAFESIRSSASELVSKTQTGFSSGFSTLLDVLEATRSLREIEQELVEAELSLNLAITKKYEIAGTLIEVAK
ncbi:MAG TPA: TolC family protein [Fimbriimonadaceae bacterium]|nr:TolC family protein [Fimbriimonadaceae bacterium]